MSGWSSISSPPCAASPRRSSCPRCPPCASWQPSPTCTRPFRRACGPARVSRRSSPRCTRLQRSAGSPRLPRCVSSASMSTSTAGSTPGSSASSDLPARSWPSRFAAPGSREAPRASSWAPESWKDRPPSRNGWRRSSRRAPCWTRWRAPRDRAPERGLGARPAGRAGGRHVTAHLNEAWARALVDELCAAGASEAVVCPGSRSTPLALACAAEPRLNVRSVVDERSGAFFALGAAKATGKPALVIATSGTAGAHFYPAILEAEASRVPLVAVTADRPPELHGFGAPQTLDQQHLFGTHVRFFADLGVPEATPEGLRHLRALAAAAAARALGAPRGPVHLNAPFREPLTPSSPPLPPPGGPGAVRIAPGRLEPDEAALDTAARELSRRPRGVIVCGPRDARDELPRAVRALSESLGYP